MEIFTPKPLEFIDETGRELPILETVPKSYKRAKRRQNIVCGKHHKRSNPT